MPAMSVYLYIYKMRSSYSNNPINFEVFLYQNLHALIL